MRPILFLLFSVIFLLPAQSAQPAQLSGFISKAYLKDTSGNAGIESLAAADFKPYAGNFQMFFENHPLWLRLTPQPASAGAVSKPDTAGPLVLRVGPHSVDSIELYERVAGQWVRRFAGDKHPKTESVCPDDYHCFALHPGRTSEEPVYLRIQTNGLTAIHTELLQGAALMAAVTSRVTDLTVSMTLALCLLLIGIFLAWHGKTPLMVVYCLFQTSVIVFLASNNGYIQRLLPMVPPEGHSFLGQASLIVRYFLMVLAGWVVLVYHKPNRKYHLLCLGLALISAASMILLCLGQTQNALVLTMLLFCINPAVQIYGVINCSAFDKGWRYSILLVAYGLATILVLVGTASLFGVVRNPNIESRFITGGDWRLNGLFVGVVFFLITLSEEISRRNDKARELEALRESAVNARTNAEKLKDRSALIDMLTHELKTPLGTIQFSLATLKRAVAGDSESIQRIQRIDSSVKRMDDMIEHVANFNKIERSELMLQRELMPASELIHEFMDEYSSQDRFELRIEPGAAFLSDRKMLSLLLENLISNAVKYSVDSTPILLTVTGQPAVTQGKLPAASWTCFEICNEVAPDKVPDESRLFERYYRHPEVQNQPGMGIGLSLVLSAAQKIGAVVDYKRADQQITFTVRVPN
jgi:signal transduction histidine kinase